jgi:hypothetical protein
MTSTTTKIDGKFLSGLIIIIIASLISWTMFFVFITIILYPIGAILILVSKKKWWVKLITTTIPLFFYFSDSIISIKISRIFRIMTRQDKKALLVTAPTRNWRFSG